MEINVTTFTNPHLFWFFEKINIKKREYIEKELNNETLEPLLMVEIGQIVAVQDQTFKRAVVKSDEFPYLVWLLDYGVNYRTQNLYKISDDVANKTPLAKQAALIDTICLQQVCAVTNMINIKKNDFTVGCIKYTHDYLISAKKLLFFCSKEIHNIHLGTVTVVTEDKSFDLIDLLVKENVLIKDKEMFESVFLKNAKDDIQLKTSLCSPLKKIHEDDFTLNGIGRGVNRTPRQSFSPQPMKTSTLEEWVQQSKLSVNNEKLNLESDQDFPDADENISSPPQNLNTNRALSVKHLKQAYIDVDNSTNDSQDIDSVNKSLHDEDSLNVETCVAKKSNQINWDSFRSDSGKKATHLNILPSGMLLSTKPKETRKISSKEKALSFKSNEVEITHDRTISSSDSVHNAQDVSKTSQNIHEKPVGTHKIAIAGCKCEQCIGWNSNDLYFNENKKQFQDTTECLKTIKHFEKPTLLLKEEEYQNVNIKSCVTPLDTKIKRSSVPTVLVHGTTFLSPVTSCSAIPFHTDIHKALRAYDHVYSIQSYVWPAIMRHMNICIIGNQNSGKTMAYLPGVCTFELERQGRYPDLPKNTISPSTVILCPGVKTAEKVFNTVLKLLENASLKTHIALAIQPIDKNCLNQFQKEAHILVATPSTLTSLISTRILTLKRLCHLIIEDANIILEKFPTEMEDLLNLTQSMLTHRNCNYTVQVIITSELWTLSIEKLLKSLVIIPVVCIGSYIEAGLYGRVDLKMHFLNSKMKMPTLSNFLKDKVNICRTVVICNANEEILTLKEFLVISGTDCLLITDDMESKDILETEARWLQSSAGKHLALICTERVFSHSINVTNAIVLVHYSLPNTWTQFIDRFRCLLDNYTSPFINNTSNWTSCMVHIYVDESCSAQFPKIVQLMQRLGSQLPDNFQTFYKETIQKNELIKASKKVKLCKNLKLFGKCSFLSCKRRHILLKDLDCTSSLPKNGIIKFKIMQIHDVTSFAIKIMEHTDNNGKNIKFDLNDDIEVQLRDAMKKQKNSVFNVKPGNWYVYQSDTNLTYHRCAIRKIISTEKITKNATAVSIRCLDTGMELEVPCSSLFEVPESVTKIHPQAIDIYLSNMVPPDSDDTWSFYAKTKVQNILNSVNYNKDKVFAMGRIKLLLGNILWLDNIMVYQTLESTNLTVNKLNLRKRLLDENLAIINEAQLNGLYQLCTDANIELPDYDLSITNTEMPSIRQVKPQWSFIDESVSIAVFISFIESPSVFYVRLKKFHDLLINLQKEIQEIVAKPFYPSVDEISLDKYYLAKDPYGDDYGRVVVKDIVGDLTKVFFVDYGDCATVEKSELKYLPDELLLKLPFQIIECRLYGIEPINDHWSASAIDEFFKFIFEPNTDYYRTLYTTSYKQEPSLVTGGMKYSVLLVDNLNDNLVIINKLLIDSKEALPIEGEDIDIEFSIPITNSEDQLDTFSDSEVEEMTFEEIKKQQEKHKKSEIEEVELQNSDNESGWNIEINKPEMFLKDLCGINTTTSSTKIPKDLSPSQPLPFLKPLPSNHSTPNILWHQTNTEIKINILLPNIDNCEMQVVRGKIFIFSTMCNERQYKLNLHLFDNVDKKFQYTLGGPHIKVTLIKKATTEWPRLVVSAQKMRYIKYDFTHCHDEEEKKKLFLDLGLKDEDIEEIDNDIVYEIGSDESYNESDYESIYGSDHEC